MDCPACKQALIVVEREGIEVDWCPACGGIWFDAGELELLAEKTGHAYELAGPDAAVPRSAGPPRRCPRCPEKMGLRTIPADPPVQIDLCPRGHGIWLDRGELGALIRAMPESQPAARAPGTEGVAVFLGEAFRSSHGRPRGDGPGPTGESATPPAGNA